jgi:hypothetical protein
MTPNGAILFGLLVIGGAVAVRDLAGLAAILAVALIFALGSGRRIVTAIIWSAAIVAPLAAFMSLVWIGIVGRAPAEIAAGIEGSRAAAAAYVAVISLRLFVVAFVIQAAFLRFADLTPLQFVRRLSAPVLAKKLIVLTLSLIETILHAIDRARTALIAAGIVTRRPSLQNLHNGWLLVQTVWLTVVTIAIGRARDKWPTEDTLALIDGTFADAASRRLTAIDGVWIVLALGGFALAVGMR